EGRTLREDRVYPVEDQRLWHDAARRHLMQHPGGGDPALGGVEHEDLVGIALPGELVARARKNSFDTVEIVARAEIVGSHERRPGHRRPDAPMATQHLRH